jgi:nitrogen regulatory protein P-II 2
MKLVVAIIKPFKLSDVHDALHAIGVSGLTVCEARGHGHQKGHSDIYRSLEYVAHYLPKLRIEIIVRPEDARRVVDTVAKAARTGESGDGKIYAWSLDEVVRIRDGDTNEAAI